MKKVVLLDENYNVFSSVEFNDNEFFNPTEKVESAPDIDYQELINLITTTDYGVDVLVPINNGEDFIVKNPATGNNILLNFMDIEDSESINDRIFDEVFPVLSEVGSSHIFKKTYKTGNPHSCKLQLYDNNNELLRSYKLKAVKFQNTVILLTKDDTNFCLLYRKEEDLFHESLQGTAVIQDGKFVRVNRPFANMLNTTVENLHNSSFDLEKFIFEDMSPEKWKDIFNKLLKGELLFYSGVINYRDENESPACFISNAIPVSYKNRPAVQISSIEVTETRKDKRKIINLKKDLEKVLGIDNIGIMYWDSINEFRWSNGIYQIIQEDPAFFSAKSNLIFKYVIEEDKSRIKRLYQKSQKEYSSFDTVSMIETSDGTIKNVSIYLHFFSPDDDGNTSAVGYVQDITKVSKLLKQEVELKEHLDQKDFLIQEVHRRVKNNLQLILNLFTLDSEFNPNDPKRTILETKNRVEVMSLIHESVAKSSDVSHLNIKDYFVSTINSLYKIYETNITVNESIEEIEISLENAIPLCLVINEIMHNIISHAFPEEDGEIKINISQKDEILTIIIGDNGVGLPDGITINNDSLGMRIIRDIISQLNGSVEILDEPGTNYKIQFKNSHK